MLKLIPDDFLNKYHFSLLWTGNMVQSRHHFGISGDRLSPPQCSTRKAILGLIIDSRISMPFEGDEKKSF